MIRVANAPVSFGVYELTTEVANLPAPDELLAAIAGAGYEGTELGPPGYLGEGAALRERLERFGLELAGAYIPLRLSEPEHWTEDLAVTAATLDLLAAAGADDARPVLADAGSPLRAGSIGRAAREPGIGLDPEGWQRLAGGVARAAELAYARGLTPTFHHHAGTCVEAPWEIERLLELTEVGLVLDTGHLAIGGGDPIQALHDWGERINHLHVKDVRLSVLAGGGDMTELSRRGVFSELGEGDVDLRGFFAALFAMGYAGWLVVEQDRIPQPGEEFAGAADAQAHNRRWLRENFGL